MFRKLTLLMCLLAGAWSAAAQLAITEVMSEASLESDPGYNRPDYWELTNFGTNEMDLTGYSWSDSRGSSAPVYSFDGLSIRPMESVIFFRVQPDHSSITNEERFRGWWGTNLSTNVQLRTYASPGLDGDARDELWVFDPNMNVVDHVRFSEARVGRSFTYNPESGVFGLVSTLTSGKSWQAAWGDDVGSPGTNTGPCQLLIMQHPEDQTNDFGADATFSVIAGGLPRPKFQWWVQYDGSGVDSEIPNATEATLTLSNIQPADAGEYYVEVHNFLETRISARAYLTVNTNPTPPVVMRMPMDLTVFPSQTAIFAVSARGFPAVRYQWQSNGVDIAGATQRILTLANVTNMMSGTRYTVRIWNDLGATNVSALLTVVNPPRLRFTEVMPNPFWSDSSGHYDWFELTNFDTNTVNLLGYRFFDTPTFEGAYTITNSVFVRPGESVIFVQQMSPQRFWNWWCPDCINEIQVITYNGFSLRELGEPLYLWNAAATDPLGDIDVVTWTSWPVAERGFSIICIQPFDDYPTIGDCAENSQDGQKGAYHAMVNGDIASPGFSTNQTLRILALTNSPTRIGIKCQFPPNQPYRLSAATRLPEWNERGVYQPQHPIEWIYDPISPAVTNRFYRLEAVP